MHKKEQKGQALVLVIMIIFVVAILVPLGANLIFEAFRESKRQLDIVGQSENVARAGIIDTISWFKRQTSQPVKGTGRYPWPDGAFDPKTSTDTAISDTVDPTIGLVKEYQLSESGNRWARYEIRRQTDTAVSPYDDGAVHDVTEYRLFTGEKNGDGLAWYIESTGYVYRRNDPAVAFNVAPNEIVSKSKVSTEIRRISLRLPTQCAFITYDGGPNGGATSTRKIRIDKNGRIVGGTSIGCGRIKGESPYTVNGGTVTGSPKWQTIVDTPTVNYVFGVSTSDLKGMADYVVTSVSSLPNPVPDMTLIYIDGNATFTSTCTLKSSGILFVNGNLNLNANTITSHLYSGLIYVTGVATIYEPASLNGCVIAYGGLNLSRSGSIEVAEIDYDASIINLVRQQLCQYRENKSVFQVFSGIR